MRKTLVGLAVLSMAALSGCDLISEATSNQVMLAQLIQTPSQQVAGQTIPAKVVTNVFLGTRASSTDTSPPTPTLGAKVHVEFGNGQSVDIPEKGDGNYATADDAIAYVPGDTYRFVATVGSDTFAVSVTAPPSEHIDEFHPDGGFTLQNPFIPISAGQSLTLHRAAADGQQTIALTTVVPVDQTGPKDPSYVDPPLDANTLLNVVVGPEQYEQPTVTVDGSKAWASCTPADYLVTVTGLKKGDSEGSNLFLGSTALAGSADAAPAHCQ